MKTMNSTKVEEMISTFRPMFKGWEIKFLDNDIKEAERKSTSIQTVTSLW